MFVFARNAVLLLPEVNACGLISTVFAVLIGVSEGPRAKSPERRRFPAVDPCEKPSRTEPKRRESRCSRQRLLKGTRIGGVRKRGEDSSHQRRTGRVYLPLAMLQSVFLFSPIVGLASTFFVDDVRFRERMIKAVAILAIVEDQPLDIGIRLTRVHP
jgi:hypothetical protein